MHSVRDLIEIALKEDIGPGDITTENLIDPGHVGSCVIVTKEPIVIAGLDVARQVFEYLDPGSDFESEFTDGTEIDRGEILATVSGTLHALLSGERTALNFLRPRMPPPISSWMPSPSTR